MNLFDRFKYKYSSQNKDVKGLFFGVFWSVFGTLISRLLMFVVWIVVANILGKEGFGEYGLIRNTVLTFSTFAGFGLGMTATRFVAEYLQEDRNKASRIASLTLSFSAITGTIVTVLVIVCSDYIAVNILNAKELRGEFILSAFILWFCAYNGAQIGVMNGLKKFKEIALIQIKNSLICFPLYILGAYFGVFWSVMAFAISNLILCLQTGYEIRKVEKLGVLSINYVDGWNEWRVLYRFSLPSTLSGLMISPVKWISEMILVSSAGFAAMGIFSAVLTLQIIVRNIANTMTSPFISFMSSKGPQNNAIDKLNILAPWLIGLVLCLPFMSFPNLGGVLFGQDYQGDMFNRTFMYVLLFTLIIMYKQGFARLFVVNNKQWVGFFDNLLWGGVLLVTFSYLKEYASVGLALSYCIAYIFVTITLYPIYMRLGWIPRNFVLSKSVVLIWLIVGLLLYLSYYDINIFLRLLLFALSLSSILLIFYRLLFRES